MVDVSHYEMALLENPELRHALAHLTSGMLSYMDTGEPSYSEEDIDKCRDILMSHAEALEHVKDRAGALDLVKSTVIRLNRLTQDAGQDLIETDQREDICGFGILLTFVIRVLSLSFRLRNDHLPQYGPLGNCRAAVAVGLHQVR
jgi:hypothetical protein